MSISKNKEVVAIIPARGGSKGIPRKNIRLLAGKPLVAYSIQSALKCPSINRIMVSTDDNEIGETSKKFGAEVIWRPQEISGDTASSESALLHALEYLEKTEKYEPDLIVFLQCTSPLTLPEDIEGTINVLINKNADSALAVTPFRHFLWRKDKKDEIQGINHDKNRRTLRQNMEGQFLETGAVYVMQTQGFKVAKNRFFGKTEMYVMPPERCYEIDEPRDLVIVEILLREQYRKQNLEKLPRLVGALVLDFDGVHTDNRVIIFQDGSEGVICDRGDGWGLSQLKKKGVPVLVLSIEKNPVVQARCGKLGISCKQGIQDKLKELKIWLQEGKIDLSQVVYVGNDISDLPCIQAAGCGVAVQDAHPKVRNSAQIILSHSGGQGAIRELVELIIERMEG